MRIGQLHLIEDKALLFPGDEAFSLAPWCIVVSLEEGKAGNPHCGEATEAGRDTLAISSFRQPAPGHMRKGRRLSLSTPRGRRLNLPSARLVVLPRPHRQLQHAASDQPSVP